MIIQFYADSLGLPRPNIVKVEETYIQIFANWLRQQTQQNVYLYDRAKGGAVIDQLFNTYKEDLTYIDGHKNILILHEGICDCAPRPISPLARKILGKTPGLFRNKIIKYIHKNRAKFLKKGFIYYHTPKNKYQSILTEWLSNAIEQFDKIIIFTIAPTNDKTEAHSPGFSSSINAYNSIITKVVKENSSEKIVLIDTYSLINASKDLIQKYITETDGHHLTSDGHQLYSSKLIEALSHNV